MPKNLFLLAIIAPFYSLCIGKRRANVMRYFQRLRGRKGSIIWQGSIIEEIFGTKNENSMRMKNGRKKSKDFVII